MCLPDEQCYDPEQDRVCRGAPVDVPAGPVVGAEKCVAKNSTVCLFNDDCHDPDQNGGVLCPADMQCIDNAAVCRSDPAASVCVEEADVCRPPRTCICIRGICP